MERHQQIKFKDMGKVNPSRSIVPGKYRLSRSSQVSHKDTEMLLVSLSYMRNQSGTRSLHLLFPQAFKFQTLLLGCCRNSVREICSPSAANGAATIKDLLF